MKFDNSLFPHITGQSFAPPLDSPNSRRETNPDCRRVISYPFAALNQPFDMFFLQFRILPQRKTPGQPEDPSR